MEVKKNKEHDKINMSEERLKESQDLLQEEKNKLKKQIKALQAINFELECNLDLYSFKDVKFEPDVNTLDIIVDPSKIPNTNVQLESELFRFGGLSCLQISTKDCIFNLSSFNEYDKQQIFAVQIIYGDNKWTLGKWHMPFDLDDIVHRFSSNIKDVPSFVRSCKHYLDCYFIRREEFNALKETVSDIKNINLHKNIGYTHIVLNLMSVYNVEYDSHMNITIYMHYDFNEVRPHKVDIESENEQTLNKEEKIKFKTFQKWLKLLDLKTAFERMLNDKLLTWSKEVIGDSPLQTYDSDGSGGGGFLKTVLSKNKQSNIPQREQKRKRKNDLLISKDVKKNKESNVFEKKKKNIQKPNQHSINPNKNNEIVISTISEHKLQHKKLKQAKLNFQLNKHSPLKPSTSKNLVTPESSIMNEDIDKVITSTPMHQNGSIRMETDSLDNISAISNKQEIEINKKRKRHE
ncbi:uncharacterized protein LOC117226598 [Megalopta genalis]|uniref:uncharacterized protein LOC117226598 n=1 Tax=Megalopta genalis TaxID=115081 RepID=UPI003FD5E60D